MSQENVEIVKRTYEAFARNDYETAERMIFASGERSASRWVSVAEAFSAESVATASKR